jgi:hypothetical protein
MRMRAFNKHHDNTNDCLDIPPDRQSSAVLRLDAPYNDRVIAIVVAPHRREGEASRICDQRANRDAQPRGR